MKPQEADAFITHMKELRKLSSYKFRINMEELQRERLTEHVNLDPSCDPPLPDWASQLLCASHLSKRTRICLLKFHNKKIREYRMSLATKR